MSELLAYPDPKDVPPPTGHYTERHGPEALDLVENSHRHIADTIAYFSDAEVNLRILLASCFGGNIAADTLISRARSDDFIDVLLPVAMAVTGRRDLERATTAFLRARGRVKKIRDTFAHGVFASRSDLPETVLVMRADPYREAHQKMRDSLQENPFKSLTRAEFSFQAWQKDDFLHSRGVGYGLLNASQGLSVCFARVPEEVGRWRSALELQGLLKDPPSRM